MVSVYNSCKILVEGWVGKMASSGEDLTQQEQESQCAGLRKAVLRDSRGWGEKTLRSDCQTYTR